MACLVYGGFRRKLFLEECFFEIEGNNEIILPCLLGAAYSHVLAALRQNMGKQRYSLLQFIITILPFPDNAVCKELVKVHRKQ